jgi:cold shock CspA family protein
MRTHGTLSKWNDERGFGFIAPAQGTGEIFVHVSAFPRDGQRPALNELVSFETEMRSDGKMQAVRVWRPGTRQPSPEGRRNPRPRSTPLRRAASRGARGGLVLGLLAFAAVGAFAYAEYRGYAAAPAPQSTKQWRALPAPAPSDRFSCDGRTMCSQMTSCAEAEYFIAHCPGTKMDGDGDGVPCEQQWCSWKG